MVAPSLTFADSHSNDGHICSSIDISMHAAPEKRNHDAICCVTPVSIDSSPGEGRHGNNHCNGDINCGTKVIEEPQSNLECGINGPKEDKEPKSIEEKVASWEKDVICQEPTTKSTCRADDMGTTQQPKKLTEQMACASLDVGCVPKGKQVKWSDNHGKELVHVFEYGVSDTGEPEEDEDDTDTCSCTIQ